MALTSFGVIRHIDDLALHLECSPEELRRFADTRPQRPFYDLLRIPKRRGRGKFRVVYRVNEVALGRMHKNIAEALVASAPVFDTCVQGFVRKRSIVTNARMHLGRSVLLHADIQDFFESITLEQVSSAFESLGCNSEVAGLLGRLCTLDGILPQGANASPVLANLVCGHLDVDLKNLASAYRCVYTRYADDITFSGDEVPDAKRVEALLIKHGFKLRAEKCRIQRRGHSQFVTGLSVADEKGPRYSRRAKRRLRLELHYASRYGLKDHLEKTGKYQRLDPERAYCKLEGAIRFIRSVEPQTADRMLPLLMAVHDKMVDDREEERMQDEDV